MTDAGTPAVTHSDDDLIAFAHARQDALVALTQALVRVPSETPPSDTAAVVEVARQALADVPGLEMRVVESVPPVQNLVARLPGGLPGPTLVLSGHLDTYPIGERAAWTQDPLGGEIVEGRLYGRGSGDMKGGCAALMETVRIFAEHMRPFPGELLLVLAGDEERMGELGTQWLIDNAPDVTGDGVIVADVGGLALPRLGEKGMLWVELTAEGQQAHGAHVHAGRNAVDAMIDALTDLRSLEDLAADAPEEAARIMREAAAKEGADGPAARRTMQRVTVNVGTVAGGVSPNLVPSRAHAALDIRIPLGVSLARLRDALSAILARHPAVTWVETRGYEASWTPMDSPIATAMTGAVEAMFGNGAVVDMRVGGSDSRLWRRAGFDTVCHGLTALNLGAPDECCAVDELSTITAVQCLTARRFLGI